jgi:hypothetical protein
MFKVSLFGTNFCFLLKLLFGAYTAFLEITTHFQVILRTVLYQTMLSFIAPKVWPVKIAVRAHQNYHSYETSIGNAQRLGLNHGPIQALS